MYHFIKWKVDTILDDFRYIKNKELLGIILELSSKKLKELNNPNIFFMEKYIGICAVIDPENIHAYNPFFIAKKFDIIGCVVTDIFFPKVKTLDDLLEAFTSDEQQKYNIQNVSSIFFENVTQLIQCQFLSTDTLSIIDFIHPIKGERLFNIRAQMFDSSRIYLAYQKLNRFEYADIIDHNYFHPIILGTIKIENPKNEKKSSIFKHFIFHSKKHNNKQYQKLV